MDLQDELDSIKKQARKIADPGTDLQRGDGRVRILKRTFDSLLKTFCVNEAVLRSSGPPYRNSRLSALPSKREPTRCRLNSPPFKASPILTPPPPQVFSRVRLVLPSELTKEPFDGHGCFDLFDHKEIVLNPRTPRDRNARRHGGSSSTGYAF